MFCVIASLFNGFGCDHLCVVHRCRTQCIAWQPLWAPFDANNIGISCDTQCKSDDFMILGLHKASCLSRLPLLLLPFSSHVWSNVYELSAAACLGRNNINIFIWFSHLVACLSSTYTNKKCVGRHIPSASAGRQFYLVNLRCSLCTSAPFLLSSACIGGSVPCGRKRFISDVAPVTM